jgi:polysaccharide export outer membrane protein
MIRKVCAALVLLGLGLGSAGSRAEVQALAEPTTSSSSEIRISLPADGGSAVSVIPGTEQIVVELPRGAVFPLDFAESSGGLLRGGEVTPLDHKRVRLELELASGLLDRVTFDGASLTLRFESRYEARRASADGPDQYRLGPDDKLQVTVHNQPELTSTPTINREGYITAPLVGEVKAAGLTRRELADRLAERLGRDYLVDPKVDVQIEAFRSQWVMVSGEVRLPGRTPLRGGTRLKEVLSEAGGFAADAGVSIKISRRVEDGETFESITIDRAAFERGEQNPILQSGDIVDVARAKYCYVQGEVRSSGPVRVQPGMTVLKAISHVGGLTQWADLKSVRILYEGGVKPRVINLKRIRDGKEEDPELTGGEVVIVDRRFF